MADEIGVTSILSEVVTAAPGTAIRAFLVEVVCGRTPEELGPVDSALDAIAGHFQTLPGIARASRGWDEFPTNQDLTRGPVITVSYAAHTDEKVAPRYVNGTVPAQFVTGMLTIDVQLDLWCSARVQRDKAARTIQDGLDNQIPHREGLRLYSSAYYRRPLVASSGSGYNSEEETAAVNKVWRRTWMLSVQTDTVSVRATPTQDTITIRATSDGLEEPETSIS